MPERDPKLDAAWRTLSTEEPASEVDAAILAAAHREAASRPAEVGDDTLAEAREPSRWWWGFAAAAAIGAVAFGVVQLASLGRSEDPTKATDMPGAETRQAREVPAKAVAPAAPPPSAPRTDDAASDAHGKRAEIEAVPAPRVAPRPAPAPTLGIAAPMESAPAASPTAPTPPVPKVATDSPAMRASLARAAASTESPATSSPAAAEFVRRIRELYDAGKLDQAARELVAFRKAYPDADAQLPASLREWAATVRN